MRRICGERRTGGMKAYRRLAAVLLAGCALATVGAAQAQTAGNRAVRGAGGETSRGFQGGVVRDIRVEGAQRIDVGTVRSYLSLKVGDSFDSARIDESLKTLFGTGLFNDVTLRRQGDTLLVAVVENPIVNRIAFEGNKRIDEAQLKPEVQSKPREVYTRTRVQNDVQRVLELYRRQGRFAATVEPKIIQLDQNRVDLVFEINEGPKSGVRGITFVGNQAFSDGGLRSVVQTKESAWWRFLTSEDNYDPDRMTYDRELLRRHYLREGYADFRVISSVAELTPDRSDFLVTFTVEEGERYKFGKVGVDSKIKNLTAEQLEKSVNARSGDWYNAQKVEDTITALQTAAGDFQYAFADVRPRINRNKDERTIDVIFEVVEGPRVFVERIDIVGNARTIDKVLRREVQVSEGDAFSATKLRRSEQRIKDLNYFEKVQISTNEGSAPDRSVVNVEVVEQSTGEISFGAGFSTSDGPLADFSIRERNLLGRGQDLKFGATVSGRRQEYDISFTEPYFMDRDVSAGFDLFRITRDYQDSSSYDERNTGFSLRLGYPVAEKLRQRLYYQLIDNSISGVPDSASVFIKQEEGTRVTSLIGQELLYDQRDSRISPTEGYYVRLSNELAGLGGTTRFLRNRLGAGVYIPVMDKEFVLSASGELGYTFGLGKDVRLADRFFVGGDTLRGFETAGIGPRDIRTGDALGGKHYARGSVELGFPLGLPEEFGLRGHAFTDVGTLADSGINDPNVPDSDAIRLSSGVGLSWKSPLGPVRVDLAQPILKESYDKKQIFRFSFGTRF
jgi:outer membrane protein insertion porin family